MNDNDTRLQLIMINLGVVMLLVFAVGALFLVGAVSSVVLPILIMNLILVIGLTFFSGKIILRSREKSKRGEEYLDIRAIIDDLVESLTPEEAIYLQRLIDEANDSGETISLHHWLEDDQEKQQIARSN